MRTSYLQWSTRHRAASLCLVLLAGAVSLRADYRQFLALPPSTELQQQLSATAEATLQNYPKLSGEDLAISVIDFTIPDKPVRTDYHGDASFYPASIIKLFFMVAVFQQNKMTPEVDRALHEMISLSDNDATAYLVDVLTDTTSGPELDEKGTVQFLEKRRKLNRFFADLGYDISAMLKPWSFGPFGRDHQLIADQPANRNRASANAVASLLYWIGQRRAISPAASDSMLQLLARPLDPVRPSENQVKGYLGEALPREAKLWSKAGNTSEVRHDAAMIELPSGRKLIVVVFTRALAEDTTLLPAIARHLLANLPASTSDPASASK